MQVMASTTAHEMNRRFPIVNFRCPTAGAHQELKKAAEKDGVSVSEWIRRAIAHELERHYATSSQ